jgi:tryptophan-rich sensory protein
MLILGGLGGWITSGSISTWYATLNHPPGKPPNEIFGPVWSALYLMIGISFALVWHHRTLQPGKPRPFQVFGLQLFLNLAWTPIFFGLHQIGLALVFILLLWGAIILTIREFAGISKPAAALLVPYLLWVSYATYLNAGYAWLN